MTEFNIQYGQSTEIFIDGQLNPNLIIEEGCWYLCIDTAELFIGVATETGLTLKRINEAIINQIPVEDLALKSELESVKQNVIQTVIPEVEEVKTTTNELKTWVENKEFLQHINLDDYATKQYVDNKVDSIVLPDVSDFATKDEVTEAIEAIEHPTVNLAGYATERFVEEQIAAIKFPEVNLDGYLTKDETLTEIAKKADAVLFTTDKFITKPIGDFVEGDDLAGLTITEIFAKLLGLSSTKPGEIPEAPSTFESLDELVDYVNSNNITIHSPDSSGKLVETTFKSTEWTQAESAAEFAGINTFYSIVDDSGSVVETGYHETTEYNEEAWLTIALPNIIKNIEIKMFNPSISDWERVNWNMVQAEEQPIEGYTIWTVPEQFEIQSGDTYRFVIIND